MFPKNPSHPKLAILYHGNEVDLPLTPLQQDAYNLVFNPNRVRSHELQLHDYHSSSRTKGEIRRRKPSHTKVNFNEESVSKQSCPSGESPDCPVKPIPIPVYLDKSRDKYCKNKTYPNFVWDANIDKYCCSETPENILTRLNHLMDALEHAVDNVNISQKSINRFTIIKNEINAIFKVLFSDETGSADANLRNFEIRRNVENKLESLIADNHTGLQTGELELSSSDKSFAYEEQESEGIPKPKTTTAMANAKWSSIMPGPGGRRRPSSKKYKKYTYIKKNQKKSKRTSKVNMKNTKRIR